ncbi:hypothetical protein, partial [Pseudooceanicola marinus]|uniref:hypothetical protein n=1 Tax=Pseudooceanicola marinus TaxID=396013 RepID=UPI001CD64442
IPAGDWQLSGATLRTTAGDVRIRCSDAATIHTLPAEFSTRANFSNVLSEAFIFEMDGDGTLEGGTSVLQIEGGTWKNHDTSLKTALFSAPHDFAELLLRDLRILSYSQAVHAGDNPKVEGTHPGSDALTSIKRSRISNVEVYGDGRNGGQCAGAFSLLHCYDVSIEGCTLHVPGPGYIMRISGGTHATVPRIGHGAGMIRIQGNHFYTEMTDSEYNQISKARNIVISNNTFDASNGTTPHSFFDLYNCQDVTFTGNVGQGGGLLFCGHAHLGSTQYADTLIGAGPVTASGNVITNPSHFTVFNFGGDGQHGSNTAIRDCLVSNNVVKMEEGYVPPQSCNFVYAFICNGLRIEDNLVHGLYGFYKEFYNDGVIIGANTLKAGSHYGSLREYTDIGSDRNFTVAGTITAIGTTTGKLVNTKSAVPGTAQGERFGYNYGATFQHVSTLTVLNAHSYLLQVTGSRYAGNVSGGLWRITRHNDATSISMLQNDGGYTVSINAENRVVLDIPYAMEFRGSITRL